MILSSAIAMVCGSFCFVISDEVAEPSVSRGGQIAIALAKDDLTGTRDQAVSKRPDPAAPTVPPAPSAPPAPPVPAANPEKIVSDHIRGRSKKSRSLWAEMGTKELQAISNFVKDFDSQSYVSRINDLASGIVPPEADFDPLRNLTKKLVTESEILNFDDETNYEKLFAEAIAKIVNEAQADAAKSVNPGDDSVRIPTEGGTNSENAAARLLKDKKAYDVFDDANRNDLAKLKAAQAAKFFPKGKPRTADGFDNLTPAEQIEAIRRNTSDYVREIIRSGMKSAGAKPEDIDLALSGKGFDSPEYQKQFEDFAAEIVNSGGDTELALEPIVGLSEALSKELQDHLKARNESYNQGDDDKIARETKNFRVERLLDDARAFLKENDPLSENLSDAKLASVKQYCDRFANPLGSGQDDPLPNSDDIDDFKTSIYGKVRELYKELGGFGRLLGVFGLKGYFAGIIADALAKRLDRVLTGDERQKIDEWASALATELHDTETSQPQQPGKVIQYPVQNPQGYTQTPYGPMVPVVPYGRWSHGAKHGIFRPGGYLVPSAAGYILMPR